MNAGLRKEGLVEGLTLPACVKNVEDHGYSLTFGIKVISHSIDCFHQELLQAFIEDQVGFLRKRFYARMGAWCSEVQVTECCLGDARFFSMT